ncbi:MAG: hypothetical protein AAF335_03360 [Bacteroidota bacterium]
MNKHRYFTSQRWLLLLPLLATHVQGAGPLHNAHDKSPMPHMNIPEGFLNDPEETFQRLASAQTFFPEQVEKLYATSHIEKKVLCVQGMCRQSSHAFLSLDKCWMVLSYLVYPKSYMPKDLENNKEKLSSYYKDAMQDIQFFSPCLRNKFLVGGNYCFISFYNALCYMLYDVKDPSCLNFKQPKQSKKWPVKRTYKQVVAREWTEIDIFVLEKALITYLKLLTQKASSRFKRELIDNVDFRKTFRLFLPDYYKFLKNIPSL